MTNWLRTHSTYVLIGTALAILPLVYFRYDGVSWSPLRPHEHLVQNAVAYLFLVLFSYLNHTVFVPRWFLAKQYRKYTLVVISCILASVYLPYRIEQWLFFKLPSENTPLAWARQLFVEEMMLKGYSGLPFQSHLDEHTPFSKPVDREHRPDGPPHFPTGEQPHNGHGPPLMLPVKLAIFFLVGSVSTLISISIQTATRLHQVETDQLQAELRQLKAQIHPHFLFNTLNSIYALAIRKDDRTAETIVKLSDFMRYMIRDAHRNKVPLEKETDYINNYIDLQRARLRDSVPIHYTLEGDVAGQQIAPLLLFSFIENAFKHGVNPDEDSLIRIELRVQSNELRLHVFNHKVRTSHIEASNGVGMPNAKDRLRLLYPNAHQLLIDDAPGHFQVALTLTLT